ncbi:hypothetical protein PGTUg99_027959 [Puccinia graminis f. sp. tritici]|uniref:Uncharacterized protein n=1 Tax=Puccinia graminis f. sp. tritici TaxID=56615 RepID=A0A5B0LWM1_PUCGR|nr:hypothetical protein PGTUg99_027959 [Puccinia graminis f. sp. tritici]
MAGIRWRSLGHPPTSLFPSKLVTIFATVPSALPIFWFWSGAARSLIGPLSDKILPLYQSHSGDYLMMRNSINFFIVGLTSPPPTFNLFLHSHLPLKIFTNYLLVHTSNPPS